MFDIIKNFLFAIGEFCLLAAIVILLVIFRKARNMKDDKVVEVKSVIIKPVKRTVFFLIAGMVFSIAGILMIIVDGLI